MTNNALKNYIAKFKTYILLETQYTSSALLIQIFYRNHLLEEDINTIFVNVAV